MSFKVLIKITAPDLAVEISNFPVGRPNKASASGDIGRILYGNYTSIDQYDYLPWREEKMRIDSSVLVELANDESAIVYYIISSPEKEPSPTLKKRSLWVSDPKGALVTSTLLRCEAGW